MDLSDVINRGPKKKRNGSGSRNSYKILPLQQPLQHDPQLQTSDKMVSPLFIMDEKIQFHNSAPFLFGKCFFGSCLNVIVIIIRVIMILVILIIMVKLTLRCCCVYEYAELMILFMGIRELLNIYVRFRP